MLKQDERAGGGAVGIEELSAFVGHWELSVDLPGAARGEVIFELMGEVLVQHTTLPLPDAPDSVCVVVAQPDAGYTQHYFDSRGTARLYRMTLVGHGWTLERTKADFTPLDFAQRFFGTFTDDLRTIHGEWQSSGDGRTWNRDFGMTYTRADETNQT
jgi:hypothetical protein